MNQATNHGNVAPITSPDNIAYLDRVNEIRHFIIMNKTNVLMATLETEALIKLRDAIHDELATRGTFR